MVVNFPEIYYKLGHEISLLAAGTPDVIKRCCMTITIQQRLTCSVTNKPTTVTQFLWYAEIDMSVVVAIRE